MKNYLYHFVPNNLQGSVLYPLNVLKRVFPDLYKYHDDKYDWRREVQEQVIPGYGKWGDVIHLSPIDPNITMTELKKAGFTRNDKWNLYRIDPASLDASNLIIMTKSFQGDEPKSHFEKFETNKLAKISRFPQWTLNYYKECKKKNINPLLYAGAPHVLYAGNIDISKVDIISVS
ncbi:MAG: hypothetical protein QG675_366 [Patescibacteria group bacterium]|jgi:hypothetical protein|nr:hypothetical protein [Patescibacteria group bacterium]